MTHECFKKRSISKMTLKINSLKILLGPIRIMKNIVEGKVKGKNVEEKNILNYIFK